MRVYLVGGAVRDALLERPVEERDWVVVGAAAEQMRAAGFVPVDADFPVFRHPETGDEYARRIALVPATMVAYALSVAMFPYLCELAGKRVYQDKLLERLDPRGVPYYWFGGPPPTGVSEPGTDFHAVSEGKVAITPIQLDLTASRLLERIHGWRWDLDEEPSGGD